MSTRTSIQFQSGSRMDAPKADERAVTFTAEGTSRVTNSLYPGECHEKRRSVVLQDFFMTTTTSLQGLQFTEQSWKVKEFDMRTLQVDLAENSGTAFQAIGEVSLSLSGRMALRHSSPITLLSVSSTETAQC